MIFIRTDANEIIGTGHVMRCLSIASKIKELNEEVCFVIADDKSKKIIEEQGYRIICLDSIWNDLNQEIDDLCKLIEDASVTKILVDSYFVTEKYLRQLKEKTSVFYIDDINSMSYPVDVLINYNIYGQNLDYSGINGRTLLGVAYAPLRKEFIGVEKRRFDGINKVLITSGGTDNYDIVGRILSKLLSLDNLRSKEFYCILGRFNVNVESLQDRFNIHSNVHLLQNVSNMDYYMKKCDIAITAGGSTSYELCACGIPSILYTIADNQLGIAKAFSEKDIISWAGDMREDMDACLDNIVHEINRLNDINRWELQSRRMQDLVDGNGANRIAQEIIR